ncbi:lipopolysaccharide assembly protein LapB [Deefgea sp. CFH1-16]|uniref:tetratricopeptide repeat protein n=1 Tax=Deefgea sp. CFH1-16 TaxID=2675457 RepID=UPI0015F358E7|nr:tetratricopeptide repeat protein [Deefgea sp. CFH1-16]MBM5574053.1 tetratricopeptide repeat protein [Deefgea sp. CFH1-16]
MNVPSFKSPEGVPADLSAVDEAAALVNRSAGAERISQFKHALAASLPCLIVGGGIVLGLGLAYVFLPYQITVKPTLASAALGRESVSSEVVKSESRTGASVATTWQLNTPVDGYVDVVSSAKALEANTQLIQASAPSASPKRSVPQSRFNASTQPVRSSGPPHLAGVTQIKPQIQRQPANSVDPLLPAWQAYQQGDFTQAEQYYQQAMQQNPRQRDAVLGLAAIAQIRGDAPRARSLYQHLLQLHPEDAAVKQALMALPHAVAEQDILQLEQSGQADPQLLAQFYAREQHWSQAQAQFFIVYSQNPSATAAFNLAVSLDHLQQPTLALQYYRQALQGVGTFDRSAVQQRIAALSAQPVSSEAQHAAQH